MDGALMRTLYTLLALAAMSVGCGQRENIGVEAERGSGDALGLADVPCKKGSCPPVPVYIDGPNGSSQFIGSLDKDNTISYSAKAERASSRNVKMRVYYGPEECKSKWSGQDSNSVSCTWRPTAVLQSGRVKAVARDVSYCLEKLNQNSACNDMSKSIPEVDKEQEFQFSVEDNSPQLLDPAFTENPGQQVGANGGIRGCGMGMLSGIIGVLQGSFMPAVMGCVSGYIGGLQQGSQSAPTNTSGSIIGGSNTNPSNAGANGATQNSSGFGANSGF